MTRAFGAFLIVCAAGVVPADAQARSSRIHKLDEMTWTQIDALDRKRTMFVLPVGMIEEHGPHLPVGADTYGVAFEANGVARRIGRALPQWNVVVMPPLNYGESGANELAGNMIHPGTYGIRHTTLRALVADVGAQVAQNGFTWIFVLNGHAAPTHNMAINEACDFVSESFGVTMLHVTGLFRADRAIQSRGEQIAARHFADADRKSFGLDVHAGVDETSAILALRPDLVQPGYRKLPSLAGYTRDELQSIASRPGWPGYLSAPARGTAAYGRAVEAWWVDGLSDLILRAVGGEDLRKAPRAPDRLDPAIARLLGRTLENERTFELKLDDWLAARRRQ